MTERLLQPPTRRELRAIAPWLVVGLTIVVVQLLVLAIFDVEPRTLLMDPAEVAPGLATYVGALTTAGVVLWFTAGAVLLFGAWVVSAGHPLTAPMRSMAALSFALGLDDRFRVHEIVSDVLEVREVVIYAGYGLAAVAIVVAYGARLRPERWFALVAATGFAVSLGIDVVVEDLLRLYVSGEAFVEENAKLAGIAVWTGMAWHLARRAIREDAGEDGTGA